MLSSSYTVLAFSTSNVPMKSNAYTNWSYFILLQLLVNQTASMEELVSMVNVYAQLDIQALTAT